MKKILITIVISLLAFTFIKDVNASTFDVEKSGKTVFVLGVEDGVEYDDMVRILTNADEITLNGEPFNSGTELSAIGNYVLECYDEGVIVERIEFKIIPRFLTAPTDELLDGGVYEDRIYIQLLNDGDLYINQEYRSSNAITITSIGNHMVTVYGVNGFVRNYFIVLEPSLLVYLDGIDYEADVTIDTDKYTNFTLNGYLHFGELELDEYGTYIIGIDGVGKYHRDFVINITLPSRYLEYNEVFTSRYKVNLRDAQKVIVDNKTMKGSFQYVEEIGNHSVMYFGKNQQFRIYYFTIEETGVTIKDKQIYTEAFKMNIKGVDMYLNGEPYFGDPVTTIGNYVFTVKGVGGYEKNWKFIIRNKISEVDGQVLEEATDLDYNVEKTFINGELVSNNYRITDTGTYHVLLVGAGDYTFEYTVSFINENESFSTYFNMAAISLSSILVVTYLFLLRRRFK